MRIRKGKLSVKGKVPKAKIPKGKLSVKGSYQRVS